VTNLSKIFKSKKCVVVSGFFSPLHSGHINYFKEAKKLGNKLIVIVNNDKQCSLKGNIFMNEQERMEIIKNLNMVDEVILSVDTDSSVCETLKLIKPDIFANGGDRFKNNIPEAKLCNKLGIKMVFNVGGNKTQSSSNLLHKQWGYSKILLEGKGWWFKRLIMNGSTSLQKHKKRDELFVFYVPSGVKHKITGKGNIMEFSIGEPQEEDIIRYK
jgi:cytidyltransferase-like protein